MLRTILLAVVLLSYSADAVAGSFVYVSVAGENRIAVYSRDAETGELTPVGDAKNHGESGAMAVDP